MTQSSVAKDSQSSVARKKAKTGDAKVLWSPANGTRDEGGAGSQNLSTSTNSFKQEYGEDLAFCDNGDANGGGKSQSARAQQSASRRKRSLNGSGGGSSAAEEMARSMSPARLAVEVQKARERARQARFGGGVKPSVAAAGVSSIAKMSTSATSQTGLPADLRSQPNGGSGGENCAVNKLSERCQGSTHSTVSTQTKNQSRGSCGAPLIDPSTTSKAISEDVVSHSGSIALSVAVAPAKLHGRASDPSKPCEPPPAPVVPPIEADEGKTDGVKGGALASAGTGAMEDSALTAKVTPVTEMPSMTALPKRDEAEKGDMARMEPTLKKMPMSPIRVLTLLLRLRSDVETAGVSESKLDGGVEECKGFDPPNSYHDNGVEECKGFDPPNLPPTPTPRPSPRPALPGGAILGLSDSIVEPKVMLQTPKVVASSPVGPTKATEVTTTDSPSSIIPQERGQALALVGQSTWGPSFGISQGSTTANAIVPAKLVAPANPWIISPNLSALAKNQGRPLARSFPLAAATEQANIGEKRVSESRPRSTRISDERPALTASGESNVENGPTLDAGGNKGDDRSWRRSPDRGVIAASRLENGTHPPVPVSFDAEARLGNEPSKRRCQTPIPGSESDQASASQQQAVDAEAANESTGAGSNQDGTLQGLKVDKMTEELLEKLEKEREESIEFDRKLTEALLDL